MLKLLKTAIAFIFISGISSAVGQQISGGGSSGGGGGSPGGSNTQIQYNNSGSFGGALLRYSSANFFLGDVDAAAPVAQTISPQNVVTGTSNTAGTDLTISGSKGTGTGIGGSVVFKTAPAGSTGTSVNPLATALTIDSTKTSTFAGNVASTVTNSSFFGLTALISNNSFLVNGAEQIGIAGAGGAEFLVNSGNVILPADTSYSFSSASQNTGSFSTLSGGKDTFMTRGGVATLQLGNTDAASPIAQTLKVQSVAAGTSNTAGTDWTVSGSVGTGKGIGGNIILQTAPAGTTGTSQNALSQVAIVDSKSHVRVGNTTAPALTSCGTSPSIVGTDVAGTVTMGTTATGCVITFKTAYANAPICNVTWRATPLASQSYALSTTAITTTQTSASNNVLDYHCFAQNAG